MRQKHDNNKVCHNLNNIQARYLKPAPTLFQVQSIYIYMEGYSESTEPIDAVNILPLARFEPTTSLYFDLNYSALTLKPTGYNVPA